MTKAQRVRMDKESGELDNRTVDIWPDQRNISDILKKPNGCVELRVITPCKLGKTKSIITESLGRFYYLPSQLALYLAEDPGSALARDEMQNFARKFIQKNYVF